MPDCSAVTGQRLIDDCNEAIRDAIDSTAQLSIESGYSSDEDDAATASTAAGDTSSAPTVTDDVDGGGGVPPKPTLKSPCVPKDVMGVDNKLYIVLSKKRTLSLELPTESDDGDVLTSGCRPGQQQQQQQRPVDNVGFDPYPPMDRSPHSFMSSSSEPTYSPKPVFLGAPSPRPSSHRSGSVGSRHSSASLVDNSSSSRHNSVSSHATPSSSPHERLSSTDSASPAAARNSIDNSVTAATQHHQNNVTAATATAAAAAASRAASSSSLNSSSIPVSTVPGHTATSIKQTVSATAAAVPTVAAASGQQSLGSFNQVPASTSSTVTSDASRRALLEQLNRQMAAIPQQTSVHSQTFVANSSQQSNSFSNWANPHQQHQQQHVDVSQPYFNGGGSGGGGGGGGGGVADNRLLVNLLQQKAAPLNGFSHSKVRREIAGYCGGGGGDVTDYNDNSYSSAFSAADWSSLQSMVIGGGGGGGGPAVAYHHGAAESKYSQVSRRFLVTRD